MSCREPWPIGGPWVVTDDYQRARRIGKRRERGQGLPECYFERIPTLALCFSNPTSTAEEAMQLLEAFAPTA